MERHRITIISLVKIFIIYFKKQLKKELIKPLKNSRSRKHFLFWETGREISCTL